MDFYNDAWIMCIGMKSQARRGDMQGVIDTLEALDNCLRAWNAAAEEQGAVPVQPPTSLLCNGQGPAAQ